MGALIFSLIAITIVFAVGISSVGVSVAFASLDLFIKCFPLGISILGSVWTPILIGSLFLLGVCVGRCYEHHPRVNKTDVLNNPTLFPTPTPQSIELTETKEINHETHERPKRSASKDSRFFKQANGDVDEEDLTEFEQDLQTSPMLET